MGTETAEAKAEPARDRHPGGVVVDWLTTTDHKKIGHLYLITSFVFFLIAGLLAMMMRAELARPGLQLMSNQATSCPPPRHNFLTIPRIRTESPAFDLHHPEFAAIEHDVAEAVEISREPGTGGPGPS